MLVDNGRSERLGMDDFWYSLKCIRCGACMNTCPVYRRSGGLSYGATYSGPIGVIIDPTFNLRKYSSLPFASTLNGSCTSVCPVKINIHEQIYKWRQIIAERHQLPLVKKEAMRIAGKVLASPRLYRAACRSRGRGSSTCRASCLQPLQCLGPAARGPGRAAVDFRSGTSRTAASDEQPRQHPRSGAPQTQPAGARALPVVPRFERRCRLARRRPSRTPLVRMGGKVVAWRPPGGARWLHRARCFRRRR